MRKSGYISTHCCFQAPWASDTKIFLSNSPQIHSQSIYHSLSLASSYYLSLSLLGQDENERWHCVLVDDISLALFNYDCYTSFYIRIERHMWIVKTNIIAKIERKHDENKRKIETKHWSKRLFPIGLIRSLHDTNRWYKWLVL